MVQPTLDIFTGSKGLGIIFKEQNQINTKFLDGNIPLTTTKGRASVRISGTRFIMLQGSHDGTGFDGTTQHDKLGDFIYEMEQWFNVLSTSYSSAEYTDSFSTSYNVDCVDWTWTKSSSEPFRIMYTLIMVEK